MVKVTCPRCNRNDRVALKSLDYGHGNEFACYRCGSDGWRFSSETEEARLACSESAAASKAYARVLAAGKESK